MWSRGEPNFNYITIALPAIMALIGLGALSAVQWSLKINNPMADRRALVLTAVVAIVSIFFLKTTLFQQWATNPDVDRAYSGRLGRLAAYLDRVRDNLTTSICTLNLDNEDNGKLSDPKLLDLMQHRRDTN